MIDRDNHPRIRQFGEARGRKMSDMTEKFKEIFERPSGSDHNPTFSPKPMRELETYVKRVEADWLKQLVKRYQEATSKSMTTDRVNYATTIQTNPRVSDVIKWLEAQGGTN